MANNRYLFQLNHPAHFHLLKNSIENLIKKGYHVRISIKEKDILEKLVKDYDYTKISEGYRSKSVFRILKSLILRDMKLHRIVREFKPDLMIGTSPEIGHVSLLTGVPSVFLGEDDVNLSLTMYLGAITCYPFFNTILSPEGVNNSIWKRKTIFYRGYQKLAYLHPDVFVPDRQRVLLPENENIYIIRLSNLNAYHDIDGSGLTDEILQKIIPILEDNGNILISSERNVPDKFKKYIFSGNLQDFHHYIYFADLLVGDSQSMAVEASVLGTPNIRFNNFVGKISILEELENKYNLTYGISASRPELLIEKINQFMKINNQVKFHEKKIKMLKEKINVASFITWFIENYPLSKKAMSEDSSYQENFN